MSIEAMKQALEALEGELPGWLTPAQERAIESLRQAIEQAEKQEPIAYVTGTYGGRFTVKPLNPAMVLPLNMTLYTTPQPQREWVGLTDEDRREVWLSREAQTPTTFAEGIEAKLKEKNT